MRRFAFPGGTAVVTGAAGGIGAALAARLAARGSDLVLLDRDGERLADVVAGLRRAHPDRRVEAVLVDLADDEATRRAGAAVAADHPGTTLLVNNAGIALAGRFDQVTPEEFDRVLAVNFRAAVRLTAALLPVLKAHPGAHLVNVSSVFGLVAPAGQAAYSASKFALRGFTEALRHELAADGVGVTSVHPGGVATRIAASARIGSGVPAGEGERFRAEAERLLTMHPDRAAAAIVRAVERRRPRQLVGATAVVPDLLVRALPGCYGRVLAAVAGRAAGPVPPGGRA